jgi:hypothetical protein
VSRTRLRLLGRQPPNRSANRALSAHRDSNPVSLAGSEACGHEHLARVEDEEGIEPSLAEVAARRLSTWPLVHLEEAGRVELPGPRPGGVADRCAKPACASLPSVPKITFRYRYRRWVLAPPTRAYETRARAGAAGLVPRRGFEPPPLAFVARAPFHLAGACCSVAGRRGIEPRWQRLERRLIPDHNPSCGERGS